MATTKMCGMAALLLTTALAMPLLGQTTQPDNSGGNAAQNNNGGGGGNGGGGNGGGGGGGRQRFDPAQMRQRMMDRLKDALGAKDDEFAVLEPKIDNVMKLSRDIGGMNFRMFGRGGRGGGGGGFGGGADQTPSAVQQALTDLQTTLDKQDATADEIKTKLSVLREARAKARTDYAAAQQDLKSLLTQRQEAVLVVYGMLD